MLIMLVFFVLTHYIIHLGYKEKLSNHILKTHAEYLSFSSDTPSVLTFFPTCLIFIFIQATNIYWTSIICQETFYELEM